MRTCSGYGKSKSVSWLSLGVQTLSCCLLFFFSSLYYPNSEDSNTFSGKPYERLQPKNTVCKHVDVVYTWVNASYPLLVQQMKQYKYLQKGESGQEAIPDSDAMLYRDYGLLRYSMRSVERFAPWVRNVILVTNGALPYWLNTTSSRFRHVTHEVMFGSGATNHTASLPNFSSFAIDSQLGDIPGLSDCFFYLQDDFFFTDYIRKEDFFDEDTGKLKVDMWDLQAPAAEKVWNVWHASMAYSNHLLNLHYNPTAYAPYLAAAATQPNLANYPSNIPLSLPPSLSHNYGSHSCFFFRKDIFRKIAEYWPEAVNRTLGHKFRQPDDMQPVFMHAHVAVKEFGATRAIRDNFYGEFTLDGARNRKQFAWIQRKRPKCACLNDKVFGDVSTNVTLKQQYAEQLALLASFLQDLAPNPSRYELVPSLDDTTEQQFAGVPLANLPPSLRLPVNQPTVVYVPFTAVRLLSCSTPVARLGLLISWLAILLWIASRYPLVWQRLTALRTVVPGWGQRGQRAKAV